MLKDIITFFTEDWERTGYFIGSIFTILGIITGLIYKFFENYYKLGKEKQADRIKYLEEELKLLESDALQGNATEKEQEYFKIFNFSGENSESETHLIAALKAAKKEIFIFGLTRNFYADDRLQKILQNKCKDVPINLFMINPDCASKKDRYRLEPSRAAYKNADYYKERIENTFIKLLDKCEPTKPGSKDPGISVHYYNFPCSFAMEKIDDEIRVFLYGYGKRGTDSPTFVFGEKHQCYNFFMEQIHWIIEQVNKKERTQWDDSNFEFVSLREIAYEKNHFGQQTARKTKVLCNDKGY